jgi:hypothetical protein
MTMNSLLPSILHSPEGLDSAAPEAASASVEPAAMPASTDTSSAPFSSDFTGLSGDDYEVDVDSVVAAPPTAPAPTVAATPALVQGQPIAPPLPTVPAPVAPAAVAPAPVQAVEPGLQNAPVQPQSQPEGLDGMLDVISKNEKDLVAALAVSQFSLSPEDLATLEVDAASMIPQLLARGYVKTTQGIMNLMRTEIPRMLRNEMQTLTRQQDTERAFFTQFPGLSRDKHGDQIRLMADALHRQNPKITVAELLEKTGRAVAAINGITLGAPAQAARPQQPAPFAPAVGTARMVSTQQIPDGNDFGYGLAQEYDDN